MMESAFTACIQFRIDTCPSVWLIHSTFATNVVNVNRPIIADFFVMIRTNFIADTGIRYYARVIESFVGSCGAFNTINNVTCAYVLHTAIFADFSFSSFA